MNVPPYLLCLWTLLSLVLGCSTNPVKKDDMTSIHTHIIKRVAETTLVHIRILKSKLLVSEDLGMNCPPPPHITGLASISSYLGVLSNRLCNLSSDRLGQIHADVSSLQEVVHSLSLSMLCSTQTITPGECPDDRGIQEPYPDTQSYLTVLEVENYLVSITKDQLNTC